MIPIIMTITYKLRYWFIVTIFLDYLCDFIRIVMISNFLKYFDFLIAVTDEVDPISLNSSSSTILFTYFFRSSSWEYFELCNSLF